MNVFMVDQCPVEAARALCDKHVVKMVLESAQLISSALDALGVRFEGQYKTTHKNHPCSVACRADPKYLGWVFDHGIALAKEYTHRYGKTHKSALVIGNAWEEHRFSLDQPDWDRVPQCMPERFKVKGFPTIAYRRYLAWKYTKDWPVGSARWTNRPPPALFELPHEHAA